MPKQLPTSKNDGKPVFARLAKFTHNQFHCSLRSPQTNNIPSILLGQRKTTQIDAPKIVRARVRLAGFPHLPPLSSPPPPTSHIGVRNLIMFIFNHGDVPVPLTFMGGGGGFRWWFPFRWKIHQPSTCTTSEQTERQHKVDGKINLQVYLFLCCWFHIELWVRMREGRGGGGVKTRPKLPPRNMSAKVNDRVSRCCL